MPLPSHLREPLRAQSGQARAAAAKEVPRQMTCLVVDAQGIPGLQLTGCVCRGLVSGADEWTDPPWHGRESRGEDSETLPLAAREQQGVASRFLYYPRR